MNDLPLTKPDIISLDVSLTSTGWCAEGVPGRIVPKDVVGAARLDLVRERIAGLLGPYVDLVVLEGYAYGARGRAAVSMGELGGVVRLLLHRRRVRWVEVSPSTLKRYATGSGSAGKDAVLVEAVRRLDYEGSSHDEADALWLWALGMDAAGYPVVEVPKAHREAIEKPTKRQPAMEEMVRAALYDRDFDIFRSQP